MVTKFMYPVRYIYQNKMSRSAAECPCREEITQIICLQIVYLTQNNVLKLSCHYSELEGHYVC
jgi:hypothetical protein